MLYPQGQLTEHLARGEPDVLWAGGAMGLTYGSTTQISPAKHTDFSLTSAFLWLLSLKWAVRSPVNICLPRYFWRFICVIQDGSFRSSLAQYHMTLKFSLCDEPPSESVLDGMLSEDIFLSEILLFLKLKGWREVPEYFLKTNKSLGWYIKELTDEKNMKLRIRGLWNCLFWHNRELSSILLYLVT